MKVVFLILLLSVTGSRAACLQDSQLSNDDHGLDIRLLENVVESFRLTMSSVLPTDISIIIRLDTLSPRVNAEIVKQGNELIIQVLGGMLRHELMSSDVLMLLLCHEIGHFSGGFPFKSRTGWSSTEGQSDFYSGSKCARIFGFDEATFIDAAISLTSIYAQVSRETTPSLDRCDERTVERTNFGYPSAQCRLDTLMSGWSRGERPRCWFKN